MGIFILWIIFSFIIAFIGNDRKIGYGRTLILSLLLSPIIGALFAIASQRNSEIKAKQKIPETPILHWEKGYKNDESSIDEELKTNERLFEYGAITEYEYQTNKQRLEKLE